MVFKDLIGCGDFITDFLQESLKDNQPLVHSLYNISRVENLDIIQTISMDDNEYNEMADINLIKEIIKRMSLFERYSQPKILDLLASFCICNDQIVHVNQDTIFTTLKE